MRIGVDLLAIQAPSCRGRGIGRYAKSLLRALLVEAPSWDFIFYRRTDLELDWDDDRDHLISEWVAVAPDHPTKPDGTLQGIVQTNPQRLDWLLVPNPIVDRRGFLLPEPVPGGPKLAAIVHDLIPALFPNYYLDDRTLASEYYRDLRRLQSYDLLLANSEATGQDVHTQLGIPKRRIVNIQAATDPDFFKPAEDEASLEADAQILHNLGIAEPFLYYLGNVDWRKNVLGLVDAYALLPEEIRKTHPLVLTFGTNAWFSAVLKEKVENLGLGDRVISTGPAADEVVRALYRRATIFLSPSIYEGFGLPILEAMSCGAAVLVADNSSQPEVAGPAGVFAQTGLATDWAEKITDLIRAPDRLVSRKQAALAQASRFSWSRSARRLRDAIETAERPEVSAKPHLAIVAYPSQNSMLFDAETAKNLTEISKRFRTLLFVEEARVPSLFPLPSRTGWYEKRLIDRIRPIVNNPPILYLVDTLDSLVPLIDDLIAQPGMVAFGNQHISALSELGPGDRVENDLRRVLQLATVLICQSPWLYETLVRIDHRDAGPATIRLGPADTIAIADYYGTLLRA